MDGFTQHFKMSEADAVAFIRAKTDFFTPYATLSAVEIGDGNINYVFRVADTDTGKSVIIKQADSKTRSGQNPLDTDHNRIEAEILQLQNTLAPGLVPKVYAYDSVMCCVVMEDLCDYQNMRSAMLKHTVFSHFSADITDFMAQILIKTTDCVMGAKAKKALLRRFINPALCDITERLVFTNPFTDYGGDNVLFAPNADFLQQALYKDAALLLEAAKLKQLFVTKAQSLLHGDLHTGSVLINDEKTMVLDPEFAFYGPAGYDIGNMIANLIFAWANAEATMPNSAEKTRFTAWVQQSVVEIIDDFFTKAKAILQTQGTDIMAQSPAFIEWYLRDILCDAAGFCGTELCRRVIGDAKVRDITEVQDANARVYAERICVLAGKRFIIHRQQHLCGEAYVATLLKACAEAQKTLDNANKKEGNFDGTCG